MNIDDIIESAQLKGRVIALNAQVETLTAEVRCLEAVVRSHERVDCLTVANLKAEVERLDNLVRYWSEKYQNENARFLRASERIAAKEGKQS